MSGVAPGEGGAIQNWNGNWRSIELRERVAQAVEICVLEENDYIQVPASS